MEFFDKLEFSDLMRVILQRVTSASVTVSGQVVAQIGAGLLCLCGITTTDKDADTDWISSKILSTRLWANTNGKTWSESVQSQNFDVLLVSQFTLHGVLKGNKPDFHKSMAPEQAEKMFHELVTQVQTKHKGDGKEKVRAGVFGASMQVELVNDGPVTLILDSDDAGFKKTKKYQQSLEGESGRAASSGGESKVGVPGGISKKQAKREKRMKEKAAARLLELQNAKSGAQGGGGGGEVPTSGVPSVPTATSNGHCEVPPVLSGDPAETP